MMTDNIFSPISIESITDACQCTHLDDVLALFTDVTKVPFPVVSRRMNCILVGLCMQGTAHYKVDTVPYDVEAGDVIIIGANQVVDSCRLSADCRGMALVMSDNFFREIVANVHEISSLFLFSRKHPVCHLTNDEAQLMRYYIRALEYKVNDTAHRFRRETVRSLMTTMVYDLSNGIYRIMHDEGNSRARAEKLFTDFIKLVEANFRTQRRVGWYALNLGITPKYLSEVIRTASRRTPNEWIDDYVTHEIRVMLKNTTLSIKDIAQQLNFPNQSFLGKYFKEHVGVSPSQYRKD